MIDGLNCRLAVDFGRYFSNSFGRFTVSLFCSDTLHRYATSNAKALVLIVLQIGRLVRHRDSAPAVRNFPRPTITTLLAKAPSHSIHFEGCHGVRNAGDGRLNLRQKYDINEMGCGVCCCAPIPFIPHPIHSLPRAQLTTTHEDIMSSTKPLSGRRLVFVVNFVAGIAIFL